ncbi:30S ribosomal protein S17 [Candidatus Woesebacteria bacterium]|nr:30S ribosomal protein S17 [Candidatus Woesebacteria bacterium]MCD8507636.1 30S ribosomal protein S17 [Candidatus Woesebacteria bacterium]MCD8526778.1 30S ribosomal protein S17 [Candidatus Woesebacteria bacterium]MCD8546476.1 30S ribosomal protein S17 [Candidatus Woesebacteria bacterium]
MAKKTIQGTVVNVIDNKTVKVVVERNWQHPIYKKYVKRTKNYLAHVADGMELEAGNVVVMTESQPISKTKRFVVTEKME